MDNNEQIKITIKCKTCDYEIESCYMSSSALYKDCPKIQLVMSFLITI